MRLKNRIEKIEEVVENMPPIPKELTEEQKKTLKDSEL